MDTLTLFDLAAPERAPTKAARSAKPKPLPFRQEYRRDTTSDGTLCSVQLPAVLMAADRDAVTCRACLGELWIYGKAAGRLRIPSTVPGPLVWGSSRFCPGDEPTALGVGYFYRVGHQPNRPAPFELWVSVRRGWDSWEAGGRVITGFTSRADAKAEAQHIETPQPSDAIVPGS